MTPADMTTNATERLCAEASPYHAELACRVEVARDRTALTVRATLRNLFGGAIYVFREDPPLVQISRGHVELSSQLPVIPPHVLPLTPHIPPVERLEHERTLDIEASYALPLREKHPYPAERPARVPVPRADEIAGALALTIGFFPEMDGNELFARRDGKQIPSYYRLARQFLVRAKVTGLAIAVKRPLWRGSAA
jgi:hypothetical protein